ncbi:hypothetical protein G9F32_04480 [Acinetobacter sp. 194]|uniref:AzlD domain-containing protein n=1 Tax=Acinetobacter shaoyimingii TaxID=2715164 RepID=UPI001408CD10|nr:AzlD domain-containing protein [Acinetobacter shaoyimingii]NHB57290.1 hypothetical protein [Acinetobacter shaoyimingii]
MNQQIIFGIIGLFLISILVRIIPAFLKNKIKIETIQNIEEHLPISVFITMATYLFITEFQKNSIAAITGFMVIVIMIFFKIKNIIVIVITSILVYLMMNYYFPQHL